MELCSFAAHIPLPSSSRATKRTPRRPRVALVSRPRSLLLCTAGNRTLCTDTSVQQLQRMRVGLMVEDIGERVRLGVWNIGLHVMVTLEELEHLSVVLMRGGTLHGERNVKENMRRLLWELREGLEAMGHQADFRLRASVEATRSELLDMVGDGFGGMGVALLMEEVTLLQQLRWLRMLEQQIVKITRQKYGLSREEVEYALREFGKVAGMLGIDEYRVRGQRKVIAASRLLLRNLERISPGGVVDQEVKEAVEMMETAFERSISRDMELRQPHGEVMLLRPRIQDIPNFDRVTDQLLRGGQPTDYGLKWLADYGVRLIVDLRGSDRYNQWAYSQTSDIQVRNIPIEDFDTPTIEQAHHFVETVNRAHTSGEPLFVHCKAGIGRTGTLISCWRVACGEAVESALGKEALYSEYGGGLRQEDFVREFETLISNR
eukprot:Plantae.Rhodophyta-Hildenbrandia_rubra.ctg4997.p1 GENE.Plantae.Rhodophyta-Hildenbrandia_rubra.ctg4997~~Plantae.Rhodophyta-Hildenbrandia_rubra.ctg4997.p1  ORF type:complete len:433 (-),score=66.55 Plantae.Rhodophyta-Hildenbrandia_rubra.ctg4997:113-1411(-)